MQALCPVHHCTPWPAWDGWKYECPVAPSTQQTSLNTCGYNRVWGDKWGDCKYRSSYMNRWFLHLPGSPSKKPWGYQGILLCHSEPMAHWILSILTSLISLEDTIFSIWACKIFQLGNCNDLLTGIQVSSSLLAWTPQDYQSSLSHTGKRTSSLRSPPQSHPHIVIIVIMVTAKTYSKFLCATQHIKQFTHMNAF